MEDYKHVFGFNGDRADFEVFWILVGVRTDLGSGPSSSKEKQHTGFVTESSLSLAYFVLIIDTKETLVENSRILQFPVPVL